MTDLPKPPVGAFSDFKIVRTRRVCQIIIEVPLEVGNMALEALGGLPSADEERWFTVVPLNFTSQKPPEPKAIEGPPPYTPDQPMWITAPREVPVVPRRNWDELTPAQQAGIRCNEPEFWKFLSGQGYVCNSTALAASAVRVHCKVSSRALLTTNGPAAGRWHKLDEEYRAFIDPARAA